MKKLIFVLFMMFVPVLLFGQGTTTFEWDLSLSEPLGAEGGYNLYASKQSGNYQLNADLGQTCDINQFCVGTVAAGKTTITIDTTGYRGRYYFIATAFITENGEVMESGYSNEVTAVYKPNPPGNLRKVANVATYPTKKVGELFAFLTGSDKNLKIIK